MMRFHEWLRANNACCSAEGFVEHRGAKISWKKCKNPDWMIWLLFKADIHEHDGWPTKQEIFGILLGFFDSYYRSRLRGQYRERVLWIRNELEKSLTNREAHPFNKSYHVFRQMHCKRKYYSYTIRRAVYFLRMMCCGVDDPLPFNRQYCFRDDRAALVSYLKKSFTPPARTNWRIL